jgi:tRNA(Ile)-lysidine synthase
MKVNIPQGKYVLAVSGGVDSMVLLDILSRQEGLELIVAHYDHGIRQTSASDSDFVRAAAKKYGLVFEAGKGNLGADASEEAARHARYDFLNTVRDKQAALSIITAHHQDDLVETAIINLLRGTGPRGLIAIKSNADVLRPLIDVPKKAILQYAKKHQLGWVEDETNASDKYLRNYIRRRFVTPMTAERRSQFLAHIRRIEDSRGETEQLIAELSQRILLDERTIDRVAFSLLPKSVSSEILAGWLRAQGIRDLDRRTIDRLAMAIKTSLPNTSQDIRKGSSLIFKSETVQITNTVAPDIIRLHG